jgi:hypothetical protein
MQIDEKDQQARLGLMLDVLRRSLKRIDDEGYVTLKLDREQAEALIDAIDLIDAIRAVTVGVR